MLRAGAEKVLTSTDQWKSRLQSVVLTAIDAKGEPVVEAAIRRSNMLSLIHFASALATAPEERVEPFVDTGILVHVREQLRLGTPEKVINGYRAAQVGAWRMWMQIVFELTSDKEELQQLLTLSAEMVDAYSQDSIHLLSKLIEQERAKLTRKSPDVQRDVTHQILSGALSDPQTASHQLGYRFDRLHQAIIIWSPSLDLPPLSLNTIADSLELEAGNGSALRVSQNSSLLWLWLTSPISTQQASRYCRGPIRVTLGKPSSGFEGFKLSHRTALIAQKMQDQAREAYSVVSYEMVQLPSILMQSHEEFRQFAKDVLGDLFDATDDVRQSLHLYLREGCNAARAAAALGIHRNTINRHLERANDLLPHPLDERSRLDVGAALEGLHWHRSADQDDGE